MSTMPAVQIPAIAADRSKAIGPLAESRSIIDRGYRIVNPSKLCVIDIGTAEWRAFTATWNSMPADRYDDSAKTRRSRYLSRFRLTLPDLAITALPSEPFVQSKSINTVHGGIWRSFETLPSAEQFLIPIRELIVFDYLWLARLLAPTVATWNVGLHQIRVSCSIDKFASPTPEGRHRDGFRCVASHLIARSTIDGGISRAYNELGDCVVTVQQSQILDTLLLDDLRLTHDVTDLSPAADARTGHRDVCVITFQPL